MTKSGFINYSWCLLKTVMTKPNLTMQSHFLVAACSLWAFWYGSIGFITLHQQPHTLKHTHLCETKGAEETAVIGLNLQEGLPNPITFPQVTHMCWVAPVTQPQPLVYMPWTESEHSESQRCWQQETCAPVPFFYLKGAKQRWGEGPGGRKKRESVTTWCKQHFTLSVII